jgi:hypothetical protein
MANRWYSSISDRIPDNTADCRTHEVVAHAHTAVAPLRGLDESPATLARLHIAYTAYARPVREHLPHVNNAVRLEELLDNHAHGAHVVSQRELVLLDRDSRGDAPQEFLPR